MLGTAHSKISYAYGSVKKKKKKRKKKKKKKREERWSSPKGEPGGCVQQWEDLVSGWGVLQQGGGGTSISLVLECHLNWVWFTLPPLQVWGN
ncbi:hypothetical protein BHE74_00041475 [Ensete ventricosum]|nr:hypothetical protein BHE74_00041475 [Ensete ventricosum]